MHVPSSRTRRAIAAVVVAMMAAATTAALVVGGRRGTGGGTALAGGECPPGMVREGDDGEGRGCVRARHPESFEELEAGDAARAARRTAPFAELKPGAYAAALAERRALAAAARPPGTEAAWQPLGTTPLLGSEPDYADVNGLGLVELNGRIQDFAHVPGTTRLYAAVATGGMWRSDDLAKSWRSVGDALPTQVVASVAWSPVAGGTLVVVTGDSAFGGNSLAGIGVYRSVDDGRTWTKARGVPDGVLGFKAVFDPTDPSVVYAATGAGLYRSTDAGASFTDVVLPTGDCAGRTGAKGCFLANMVTDVVVRAPDRFGHAGGSVLAAVGWRAGTKTNPDGTVQSPGNGLYASPSGAPRSFTRVGVAGFAPQERIGRIELGLAAGPDQNHNYVYAVVQDAVKFNGGAPVIDVPEEARGQTGPLPNNNVLNGVYVSGDFGSTWTQMTSGEALQAPTTGSALIGTSQVVGRYGPGIQAWYNEWIQPDPTRQVGGVPTRLTFGLEEVWQNEATDQPQVGPSSFKVIGRYFSGTTCIFLDVPLPACPTNRQVELSTTTHPDQHGAVYVPDGAGGVTLVVGNDGGAYSQAVAAGQEFDNTRWGAGANRGFHTLLPYDAVMARDGTVWSGLQDNGQMKIQPDGRQIATFGGDGLFAAVDPDNADVAYEETPRGDMRVTTNGGRKWRDIDPELVDAAFVTPFMMDPTDARHLLIAGRNVRETVSGPDTGQIDPTQPLGSTSWQTVYDLGTRKHPGDAGAQPADDDAVNQASAVDLQGDASYIGFCGYCDTITQGVPFASGLATNVGGSDPPKRTTASGWHIAAAAGLPNRIVTSIAIDPADPRTVYVTLGGYARRWAPPGAVGDDVSRVGRGHVFKSTDAGASFRDISADLPDIPATWVELRQGHLLVATDIGVFVSRTTDGGGYSVLGRDLPIVPVSTVRLAPHDPNLVVAATFGRGVYTYRFPAAPAAPPAPAPAPAAAPRRELPATGGSTPATAVVLAGLGGLGVVARGLARRRAGAK